MTFIYFACELHRISNVIVGKTLILNYNGESDLGICLFFFFFVLIYIFIL